MKKNLFPALRFTLVLLVLCSLVYTLAVFGIAQLIPGKGHGERIEADSKTYYANIGQSFTEDRYFNSRPSAVNYNATGSGGSNKGPANREYLQLVQARIDTFLVHNPAIAKAQVPVELVTASGSGLDPDISPRAAYIQVKRISAVRHLPEEAVKDLVRKHTQTAFMGMFGPARVNVLKLNLALDKLK